MLKTRLVVGGLLIAALAALAAVDSAFPVVWIASQRIGPGAILIFVALLPISVILAGEFSRLTGSHPAGSNFRVGGGPSIPIPVPNPGINPGIPPQGTTGALFNQTPNPTSPRGFVPPRPTTNGRPPVITPAPSPVANPIGTPVTIANPGQPLNSATPPSDTRRRIRTIAAP